MRYRILPKVFKENPVKAWGGVVCAVITLCILIGGKLRADGQETMPRSEITQRFKEQDQKIDTTVTTMQAQFVTKDAFTELSKTVTGMKADVNEVRTDIKDILRNMPRRGEGGQ